jgi:hypothetical protein
MFEKRKQLGLNFKKKKKMYWILGRKLDLSIENRLRVMFWVVPRRVVFNSRRFGNTVSAPSS